MGPTAETAHLRFHCTASECSRADFASDLRPCHSGQSGARQILLVLPSEALRTHSADLKTNSASPGALLEPRETTINTWRAGTDCVTDHDQEAAMIASALFRTSSVANTPKRTSVPTANCCGPYLWSEHEETHR